MEGPSKGFPALILDGRVHGVGRASVRFAECAAIPVGTHSDFDRYVAEHNIPEEEWPEAFARWIAERTGGPVPRFEMVEPGVEQILPPREQRELDALPSGLDRKRET